jgi:hypothetical protein
MAHIQSKYAGLWKPQDLTLDKISSQKMFIDNIDATDNFAKVTMQKMHASVKSLTELRAINTSDTVLFSTGMLIMVQENGIYSFNRSSTADDDNNAIIAPTTGGGRWITTQGTDIALSQRYVNSTAELDTLLTTIITQMSPSSVKFLVVRGLGGTEPPLYGGAGHITIHKNDNLYATVTMIMYNHDRIALYYTRTRYDGIWGRWVTLPYLDANGKIPVSQLPSGVLPASVVE